MESKEKEWIQMKEMERNSGIGTMRDPVGDLQLKNREKRSNTSLSHLTTKSIMMISLMVIFPLLLTSCGKESTEDINPILRRLNLLEEILPNNSEIGNKIDRLESQVKELQESISKLDREGTILRSNLENINKQVSILKEELSSVSSKIMIPEIAQKKATSQVKGNYHEVQLGETLYEIAKKYGLSVEELSSMNNISKGQTMIYPGQKILVK
jgi:LysM repeat protein